MVGYKNGVCDKALHSSWTPAFLRKRGNLLGRSEEFNCRALPLTPSYIESQHRHSSFTTVRVATVQEFLHLKMIYQVLTLLNLRVLSLSVVYATTNNGALEVRKMFAYKEFSVSAKQWQHCRLDFFCRSLAHSHIIMFTHRFTFTKHNTFYTRTCVLISTSIVKS